MPVKTFDIQYIESRVNAIAAGLGINPTKWLEFITKLADLKHHNKFMYTHSLRVGIYAHGIACLEKQTDLRFPLFAGCGHDIGKCEIENTILNAKNGLTTKQFEDIKRHTLEGFKALKDTFLYTSYIAGLHHKYQANAYGIDLDADSPIKLNPKARAKVVAMAKQVMIADFFDALTTRDNDKGLVKDRENPQEVRNILHEYFPEADARINWLLANRI